VNGRLFDNGRETDRETRKKSIETILYQFTFITFIVIIIISKV
jgi:hypothetical protein